MNLLTDLNANIDNTIPIWGVLVAVIFGGFYIVKMKFEIDQLGKDMNELKELMHELLVKK